MFVQAKNSGWYSIKPKGTLSIRSIGLSVSGHFSVIQKANLYNRFDFPCTWSDSMHLIERDMKSAGLELIPVVLTNSMKRDWKVLSSQSIS